MKKTFVSVLLLFITVFTISAQDESVLFENTEQEQNDSARISALLELAGYYTYTDTSKAKEYLKKSEDLLKNFDDGRYDLLKAILYNKKGTLYSVSGDYVKALENYHKTIFLLYDIFSEKESFKKVNNSVFDMEKHNENQIPTNGLF